MVHLSRLQADILLMDEPTNHLDVANVKWVLGYIQSLTDTTCIMVSTNAKLLNSCCSHMICFEGPATSTLS